MSLRPLKSKVNLKPFQFYHCYRSQIISPGNFKQNIYAFLCPNGFYFERVIAPSNYLMIDKQDTK